MQSIRCQQHFHNVTNVFPICFTRRDDSRPTRRLRLTTPLTEAHFLRCRRSVLLTYLIHASFCLCAITSAYVTSPSTSTCLLQYERFISTCLAQTPGLILHTNEMFCQLEVTGNSNTFLYGLIYEDTRLIWIRLIQFLQAFKLYTLQFCSSNLQQTGGLY